MAYGTTYGMPRVLLPIVCHRRERTPCSEHDNASEKSIHHSVIRYASASTFRLYHVTGTP
jgi:hypothetical protein